ncbi:hypothetical protein C1I98_09930 [Spongiactinospora gelatinilytica]|uniref:Uncharacterized protein n=1 Tax=Spongiactinospora gelatinilytica TaxID=2666298 RepID=A0A2W2IL10_9ACTN|nr:hypothetical protein C1I98_09930 [Spongiactinospora gelatinilytica]
MLFGRNVRPVWSAVRPRTRWTYRVVKNRLDAMIVVSDRAIRLAAATPGTRNDRNLTSGVRTRRSTATRTAGDATAAASSPRVGPAVKPSCSPRVSSAESLSRSTVRRGSGC